MSDTSIMTRTAPAAAAVSNPHLLFRKITPANMGQVWELARTEPGRTCDFSFGGILMWCDLFDYQYAIVRDTLFIKGRSEEDMQSVAFSLPVGKLAPRQSIPLLKQWCDARGERLRLSAVPEYALEDILALEPAGVRELDGWGDYLYDIDMLATLSGKKMAKKRNHVNQFVNLFGEDCYERITPANLHQVEEYMRRLELEPAPSQSAAIERRLAMGVLKESEENSMNYLGGMIKADRKVVAFTIGDIKGDTLFIHIEKADRDVPGAYETINKAFAADMLSRFPQLRYVNREDDSGEEGLRKAKMSYHPVEILRKYQVDF